MFPVTSRAHAPRGERPAMPLRPGPTRARPDPEAVSAGLAIRDASMVVGGALGRLRAIPAVLLHLELAAAVVASLAGINPLLNAQLRRRGPLPDGAQRRPATRADALGVDHDVKVYPGAGHGFINDPDPADATPLLIFLARISGTRYHEPSARDARRRNAAFFTKLVL